MTRIFKTLKPVSCCLLAVVMFASCILPSAKTPTASAADVTVEVTTPAQGDINGDGAVNMMDITYLYNAVSGKITADLPDSADLNNDGSINVMDVNALYRHVSGAQALAPAPSEFDLEVLRYVNIEREKAGVEPLEYGYAYQAAANIRANEVSQFFSHTRPDGSMCFTVL
ncbi:MAG: hypothetical protein IKV35_04620, partial [Clostridia bacterium]|nr:hypothetical protein [Clostridia bacterium]